jgi:hypothetical protein
MQFGSAFSEKGASPPGRTISESEKRAEVWHKRMSWIRFDVESLNKAAGPGQGHNAYEN